MSEYPVEEISETDLDSVEQMGSKTKRWDQRETRLFKFTRPGTGDDWVEKVVEEIARALGLPAAEYKLARCDGRRGVLSTNFVDRQRPETLIHGNELLAAADPTYLRDKKGRYGEHTIDSVFGVLAGLNPASPEPGLMGRGVLYMAGYLVLDALVANTDRHHENWGVLVARSGDVRLAPTFDHASSLATGVQDSEKERRLRTRDRGYSVSAFACRARSALYGSRESKKPLDTVEVVVELLKGEHEASVRHWLASLQRVHDVTLREAVARVPSEFISDIGRAFTCALLSENRKRLLELS